MAALIFGLLTVLLSTLIIEASQIEIDSGESLSDLLISTGLKTGAYYYGGQYTETAVECSSCSTLSMSINTSIGHVTVEIECNTTRGEYCNKYLKRCSDKKSDCSFEGLQCRQEGWFPHPFDCTKYYECALERNGTLVTLEYVCSNGTTYNAKTYLCDGSGNSTMCQEYPVPECPDTPYRDAYPLPQNPNIFYTCEEGVPQLYRCTEGEDYHYDPELLQCERNGNVSTTTTVEPQNTTTTTVEPQNTTTTTVEPQNTTTTTVEPQTTTEDPNNSTAPGKSCNPDKMYHLPYSCSLYYNCSNLPLPSYWTCANSYFDRDIKACFGEECPYKEQNNAICNGTNYNEYFPIPGVCNSFYKCSDTGVSITICLGNYYFDREKQWCAAGSCPYDDF